jgi:hypothetical protein
VLSLFYHPTGASLVSSLFLSLVYPVAAIAINIQPLQLVDGLKIDVGYLPKGHRAPFAMVAVDHKQLNKTRDFILALNKSHKSTVEAMQDRYRSEINGLELSSAKALQIIEVRLDHEVERNTALKKELEEIDKKHQKEIKSYYWQNLGLSAALGASIIWAISASI